MKTPPKDWQEQGKELLYLIKQELSPLGQKYGYSDVALEASIAWKPVVLILGNYSSGKSTLINEFVGRDLQATGQAPTDDCFTVITSPHPPRDGEERQGRILLSDPEFPFALLKRHGEILASHFRLKEVASEALESFVVIDTPGMLDSVTERDRGYDYQAVIGDLAKIADLIFVLFDPHKAGTLKESYASLRHTLPEQTFEDRVIFVLNRVDECTNMEDLLRVYGTLCWNLSQMIGRKEIPRILLTYSEKHAMLSGQNDHKDYLHLLKNQRKELFKLMSESPKWRIDHLITFLEHHGGRLLEMVTVIDDYVSEKKRLWWRSLFSSFLFSLVVTFLIGGYVYVVKPFGTLEDWMIYGASSVIGLSLYFFSHSLSFRVLDSLFHKGFLKKLQGYDFKDHLDEKEKWEDVQTSTLDLLEDIHTRKHTGLTRIKKDISKLKTMMEKTKSMRSAIHHPGETP